MKNYILNLILLFFVSDVFGQNLYNNELYPREHILFDFNWKFALGHATDAGQDFNNGTGYFSYFAKTGYGDGAAAQNFDDRAWRVLDLPHDWCVELPIVNDGSHSHGFNAMGRNYPENSVGWYRKSFNISQDDFGKKISIEFEGVFRNSIVWINGFYLGTELSGYNSFEYDISDYLNYGGENVVAVRVDATMQEGWYYEGAGIYRHVYLNKVSPVHIGRNGTFVTTEINDTSADVKILTTIDNSTEKDELVVLKHTVIDAEGNQLVSIQKDDLALQAISKQDYLSSLEVVEPKLWSIESPNLYNVITELFIDDKLVDKYKTTFGMRSVRFDANKGFFLNGEHIKIVGANNHKDHAGVGTAMPDALIEWRIKQMKEMGANGIRTSHDPPSPAFLNACDRLGMLVLAETRLSGSNSYHLDQLESFMKRDRNHPSIVLWSLGNEEWAIEGNEKGARITQTMQKFAQKLDTTRAFTVAVSGGWDNGTGTVAEVMGYNYIVQGDIDVHHKKFPWQPSIGTEETTTRGTRGVYVTDDAKCHLRPTNTDPSKPGCEFGWNFYNEREFLSGIFYWTGFDYRGEPTPYTWPAVTSQFGILDLCGFPKDIFYYLQSWWQDDPVMHIWSHWNWPGDEGEEKTLTVYSNCEEVELFLNKKSLGKKTMPRNGHLEWTVKYVPGMLVAQGYNKGKKSVLQKVETAEEPKGLQLISDRSKISADNMDVAVITVQVNDKKNRLVPTANVDLTLEIEGPGKIIGVGNGNPSSHEPDRYFETITIAKIENLKELPVDNLENRIEVKPEIETSTWKKAFDDGSKPWDAYEDTLLVVRGTFQISDLSDEMTVNLFTKSIMENQSIYVNGVLIKANITRGSQDQSFELDHAILNKGENTYALTGQRFKKRHRWDEPNTDPGLVQLIEPARNWKRKTFNGLTQVIVQSTDEPGEITLKVKSHEATEAEIKVGTN